jgi:hypothetical protein
MHLVNTCLSLQEADPSAQLTYEDSEGEEKAIVIHCPITLTVLERDNKTAEDIRKVFSKKLKYR